MEEGDIRPIGERADLAQKAIRDGLGQPPWATDDHDPLADLRDIRIPQDDGGGERGTHDQHGKIATGVLNDHGGYLSRFARAEEHLEPTLPLHHVVIRYDVTPGGNGEPGGDAFGPHDRDNRGPPPFVDFGGLKS